MKKLLVNDGTNLVENIVLANGGDTPPSGYSFHDVQDGVNIGWELQGDGTFTNPNPPPPPSPEAVQNWAGFNSTFLADANWVAIAPQFSTPDIRSGIVAAAATANAGALQVAYGLAVADLTAQSIPLDPLVLNSWQAIAIANNIPVTFTLG